MTYFEEVLTMTDEQKLELAKQHGFSGGIVEINDWLVQAIEREKQELEEYVNG